MSSSNQPADLDSICRSVFIPLRIYPDGSHISRRNIQVGLQEMEFQRHVAPQGTVAPRIFLLSFLIFYFPQKVTAYIFKRVPGSIVSDIQFIFEVEVLKKTVFLEDGRK